MLVSKFTAYLDKASGIWGKHTEISNMLVNRFTAFLDKASGIWGKPVNAPDESLHNGHNTVLLLNWRSEYNNLAIITFDSHWTLSN